jgi:two-component system cell cycle response regulator
MTLQMRLEGGAEMRRERVQFLNENAAELAKFVSLAIKAKDLYARAVEDPLTGLATRRHFLTQLDVSMQLARRHGEPLSLVMIDVDHFKKINDTFGHLTGDRVLKEVGEILQKNLRGAGDLAHCAYRYGGEEMSIILPKTSAAKAVAVADRIRRTVEGKTFRSHRREPLRVTVSAGVAPFEPTMTSLHDLISAADDALYRAKEAGRNRVCEALRRPSNVPVSSS